MADPLTLAAGGSLLLSALGSAGSSSSIKKAAQYQKEATELGVQEQRAQFEALQNLLSPYTNVGQQAIQQQYDYVTGLQPRDEEQLLREISSSPEYEYLLKEGETALLQNASATGGLRGGNTQQALASYRPALLSQLRNQRVQEQRADIDQRYAQLGGLSGAGLQASSALGGMGQNFANTLSGLYGQQANAQAQAQYNLADNRSNLLGDVGSFLGFF